jgi:preprotein translocase SecE subunit
MKADRQRLVAMNRQMRRQQAQTKVAPRPAGPRTPMRPTALAGGAARPGGTRGSMLRPNWIRDIWSELKKVQWPTRQEAWNLTLVVILVSVVVGAALGGLDTAFGWFLQHIA